MGVENKKPDQGISTGARGLRATSRRCSGGEFFLACSVDSQAASMEEDSAKILGAAFVKCTQLPFP